MTILNPITTKAPGSMMLLGEHAVLHGQPAIVSAINRWITLTLSPRQDQKFCVQSNYGSINQSISEKPNQAWAQWLYFVVQSFFEDLPELQNGLTIEIESSFEGAVGLSSSTALTVSLLYALANWIMPEAKPEQKKRWVFEEAMDLLRQQGKVASGAALQAVIYGGLRFFDAKQKTSQLIEKTLPYYLVYCGYKTPTEQVVQIVADKFKDNPAECDCLYNQMGIYVLNALKALEEDQLDLFYQMIDHYFDLQIKLGVVDEMLAQMIELAHQSQNTLAAKVSGAGLGDCVLVMGGVDKHLWRSMQDIQMIEVHTVEQGVQVC